MSGSHRPGFLYPRIPVSKEIKVDLILRGLLKWLLDVPSAKLLELSSGAKFFKSVFNYRPPFFPPPKKSLHGVPCYELVKRKTSSLESGEGQVQTKDSPSISFHFAAPETPGA